MLGGSTTGKRSGTPQHSPLGACGHGYEAWYTQGWYMLHFVLVSSNLVLPRGQVLGRQDRLLHGACGDQDSWDLQSIAVLGATMPSVDDIHVGADQRQWAHY